MFSVDKLLNNKKLLLIAGVLIIGGFFFSCSDDTPQYVNDARTMIWADMHEHIFTPSCDRIHSHDIWLLNCHPDNQDMPKAIFWIQPVKDNSGGYKVWTLNGKASQYAEHFTQVQTMPLYSGVNKAVDMAMSEINK